MRRTLILLAAAAVLAGGCQTAPKTVLRSSDIPVGAGTRYEAYQNNAGGETAAVAIGVEGPWDFSEGPDRVIVKSQIVKTAQAADHEAYPGAKYAEKILPSDYTSGAAAYNFASKNDIALESFGQSVVPLGGESSFRVFSKSERLLVFPLRVGDKWTDTLAVVGEAGSDYTVTKEVIARGQVKVPAGEFFDCFMVRITKISDAGDGTKIRSLIYAWWSPGVGLVAAAGSRPGEERLFFEQAAYLFRLKSYKVVD